MNVHRFVSTLDWKFNQLPAVRSPRLREALLYRQRAYRAVAVAVACERRLEAELASLDAADREAFEYAEAEMAHIANGLLEEEGL